MKKKNKGIEGILRFTKDSPYYLHGEKERVLKNITEIHYNFHSKGRTAFESDIEGTGFTIPNEWIKEFEVFSNDNEKENT